MVKKVKYPESSVSKLSHENMTLRIFTQKHDKLKFHHGKNFIHGNNFHPLKSLDEKSYPWIKVSSMKKMKDDFFICGCRPWMKSTDKDNE